MLDVRAFLVGIEATYRGFHAPSCRLLCSAVHSTRPRLVPYSSAAKPSTDRVSVSVADPDPGSGAIFLPWIWIRDRFLFGSRFPTHIYESSVTIFVSKNLWRQCCGAKNISFGSMPAYEIFFLNLLKNKIRQHICFPTPLLLLFDPGSSTYGKSQDPECGTWDKYPGTTTLVSVQ